MKKLINTAARLSLIALVAFFWLGLQASNAFAQEEEYNLCWTDEDAATPRCKAALSAFKSAYPIVTGEEINTSSPTGGGNLFMRMKVERWIITIAKSPEWKDKFNEGLKFTEAVMWLKSHIAQNKGAKDRAMAINNAFWEVHGRGATPFEQAAYEVKVKAQKAWYATIVAEQIKELNKKASDRTTAINRSYQIVFGRNETPDEQKYWLARPEHYRLLVDVHRSWLYSSAGTDELVKTVARALNFKNKNNPSSYEVKEAMVKFTPGKKIYTEMLN